MKNKRKIIIGILFVLIVVCGVWIMPKLPMLGSLVIPGEATSWANICEQDGGRMEGDCCVKGNASDKYVSEILCETSLLFGGEVVKGKWYHSEPEDIELSSKLKLYCNMHLNQLNEEDLK